MGKKKHEKRHKGPKSKREFRRDDNRPQQKTREVEGVFSGTRQGFGFVAVEGAREDVFIPPRYTGGAFSGDRVRVQIKPEQKRPGRGPAVKLDNRGPVGEVIEIKKRGMQNLIGTVSADEDTGKLFVIPRFDGFPEVELKTEKEKSPAYRAGDLVYVEIQTFPTRKEPHPVGVIRSVIGKSGDPKSEEKAILLKFQIREDFPQEVLDEVKPLPPSIDEAFLAKVMEGRKDLRDKLFFTIDGQNARDFDDAVCLEREGGNFRLWVAIADVANYVRPGTALDTEAYARATSVYFPTRAIHMLPEKLSAGLCSLRPNEDRLAMVAEMVFGSDGRRKEYRIYEGVFRSKARLTYEDAQAVFDRGHFSASEPILCPIPDAALRKQIEQSLLLMRELQEAMFKIRKERGSLDFDIPEAQFIFAPEASFTVDNIIRGERLRSHRMIEEFMVAANETVAEFMTAQKRTIPYRIHEPPDPVKIEDFLAMLRKIPDVAQKIKPQEWKNWSQPGFLARVLNLVKDLPEARVLNHLLLTSLKLAVYEPNNKGHFGLASECYSHFTSPIRRYPDLMLHRAIKNYLAEKPERSGGFEQMRENCEHCSKQEQTAVSAEREVVSFYKALFMKGRLGQKFTGRIVKLTNFGFFVELDEIFVDGFVPLETLKDDQYLFREDKQMIVGRKRQFRQGDPVNVIVASVDLERRRIGFGLDQAD